MSYVWSLVLVAILVFCEEIAAADKVKDCNKNCSDKISPVCDENGTLYNNECYLEVAKCQNHKIRKVKWDKCTFEGCKEQTICPLYVKPVCGSDGKWYSNTCFLLHASCGRKEGPIKSVDPSRCPEDTTPIATSE